MGFGTGGLSRTATGRMPVRTEKVNRMKNIEKINPFKSTTQITKFGNVTTLITEKGISAHGSIAYKGKTLLANYVYKDSDTYHLVYTTIDNDGKIESFKDPDGILPTLFLSPDKENYVSIVPYHSDKELEISIPVFNRGKTELPKGNRPFLGDFIGTSHQFSIFYDVDRWSKSKPDKLLAIEFKNGVIKKKQQAKIGLPCNNKIFISNHEIHLLAKDENGWLHRLIDEKGNAIRNRRLHTKQSFYREIISLSFDGDSYLLSEEDGKIIIEKIAIDGNSEPVELIDITDPFFNTWRPVKISENTFVTRFNGEFGNGWFTTRNEQLLEIFYSKGLQGYRDLLSNDVWLTDKGDLIISSINNTTENAYSVVFYPKTDRGIRNNELVILNRSIEY